MHYSNVICFEVSVINHSGTQENDQNHSNMQSTITLELVPKEENKQIIKISENLYKTTTECENSKLIDNTPGVHFLTDEPSNTLLVPKVEENYDNNSINKQSETDCPPVKNKNELLEYLIRSDGSVICKMCGEILASRTHWYRHKYKFHATSTGQPAPLYKCEQCHVFFKSRKGYIGHLASRHTDPEPIACTTSIITHTNLKQEPLDPELAIPKTELSRVERKTVKITSRPGVSTPPEQLVKNADWEQEQREKEEKLVADIIDRVRKECEAQGATVSRRGYSRRSTVMNTT